MESIRACSIWRALEVIGDVPVLLIVEQAFLGTRDFEGFVQKTGVARSVLSGRLRKLVDAGCLAKVRRENSRRHDYILTQMGRDQFPIALMMLRWQHRWEAVGRGFQVELIHSECGQTCEPVPECSSCQGEIDPRMVDWAEGPGLVQVTPTYGRRRRPAENSARSEAARTMADTVLELFGDRWATLVVRAMFTGINRFDDIQRDAQMASNILSDRIDRLLVLGILRATPYSDRADRFEYHLTEKGRDLYHVILGLLHWGDRWFSDEKGPPLLLTHRPCGEALSMKVACSNCGGELELSNTRYLIKQGLEPA